MSDFFLLLFILLCSWTIGKIIINPKLAYEYPYFMGAMFAVFLIPQAISIKLNPGNASPASIDLTFFMCFLCLLMAVLGYYFGPSIIITKRFDHNLDLKKLIFIATAYTIAGGVLFVLINRNPMTEQKGNWNGIITIYCMLFQIINVAFAICVFLALYKKKPFYIILAIIISLPIISLILFAGRRELTALFVLTIAMAFFYIKGFVPPRVLIIAGLVSVMLIIPLIGMYRQNVETMSPLTAITSIDIKNDFVTYFKEGKDMELTLAVYMVEATTFFGSYDFGADYWNEMVFRYFPGQIFGRDLKASLMLGSHGQDVFKTDFIPLNGLTTTCVGDSFRHFGLLGGFFYFFLGGFFRELYRLSFLSNILVKAFYVICMVQALLSVSHGSVNFMPGIFHMYIFLWIAAAYSKADE